MQKMQHILTHRFILEPYQGRKTRYDCPQCRKKKQFTRYIDLSKSEYISEIVGKCNRENNCGYHFTPKQYFEKYPTDDKREKWRVSDEWKNRLLSRKETPDYLSLSLVEKSLKAYHRNNFTQFLVSLFLDEVAKALIDRFKIGTSNKWNGSTVFWQIDINQKVRSGKVMLYNKITGKREKTPFDKIDWVHSILKRSGQLLDYNLVQCFFGEHQLKFDPKNKPIAVVESEKTAIIMTAIFPKYIWLAAGSKGNIKLDSFLGLRGRRIVLFPDLGAYEKWCEKAENIKDQGLDISVSNLLEKRGTTFDKSKGFDIADYFIKYQDDKTGLLLKEGAYPFFWDINHKDISIPT